MEIINELISYNGRKVRTVGTYKTPWFCGKDVAEILGYIDANDAIRKHVDVDDKKEFNKLVEPGISPGSKMGRTSYDKSEPTTPAVSELIDHFEGCKTPPSSSNTITYKNEQKLIYINESGLYSLILSSKLPKAKQFKKWVTSELLPTLRKKGEYALLKDTNKLVEDKDIQIKEQKKLLEEHKKEVEQLKFKTLQMSNFVTNVKVRNKTDYIYIVTTAQYAASNNFKIGHTDNLKSRLSSYNTGQASVDQFYYCYARKVYEASKFDKLIHDLLVDFKDSKRKENVILHFSHLERIISFVLDNFNESFDYLNTFIKHDLSHSYELRPLIPSEINIDIKIGQLLNNNEDFIALKDMSDCDVFKLIEEIIDENTNLSNLTRTKLIELLENKKYSTKGCKRTLWEKIKTVSNKKKMIVLY